MRTLGIDLATVNGSTGVCEIDWTSRTSNVDVGQLSDAALMDQMQTTLADGGWVAIDAPFGFPSAFTEAVGQWDRTASIDVPDRLKLIRRLTDIDVHGRQASIERAPGARWSAWPLSAVVERITPTTVRCAALLTQVADGPVDRIGFSSQVVEVYPIASLRLWEVATNKYKTEAEDCHAALKELCSQTGIKPPAGLDVVKPSGLDDVVDAFVCALMAKTVATTDGATGPDGYSSVEREEIRQEGWIHLPPRGHRLRDLAD